MNVHQKARCERVADAHMSYEREAGMELDVATTSAILNRAFRLTDDPGSFNSMVKGVESRVKHLRAISAANAEYDEAMARVEMPERGGVNYAPSIVLAAANKANCLPDPDSSIA